MIKKAVLLMFTLLVLVGCSVGPVDGSLEVDSEKGLEVKQEGEIGINALLDELQRRGLNTADYFIENGQIVVEGDIGFNIEKLKREMTENTSRQYADIYLVSQSKVGVIYVKTTPDVTKEWNDAVDKAITEWNSIPNCRIRLNRTKYGSGDIVISNNLTKKDYHALASFPDSDGKPGPTININPDSNDLPMSIKQAVMVHEIGHCLGMRHINKDETERVHIPGTPVRDYRSIMLPYIQIWKGFSDADINAAQYLYPHFLDPYVIVYEDEWFKGKRWIIHPGDDIAKAVSINLNNSISSVKCVNGAKVKVYDGENYIGESMPLLDYSYSSLKKNGFDNRISSIKWNTPTGPFAVLYEDQFYGGRAMIVESNQGSLSAQNFNNKISSVKFFNGLKEVVLCDGYLYTGQTLTLKYSTSYLSGSKNFDNKATSIILRK